MAKDFGTQDDQTLAHFHEHGWVRVPEAFDANAAAAMRSKVWEALAKAGIRQNIPSTWSVERPTHFQRLKEDPVFRAVGSKVLLARIDEILEGRAYDAPKKWGAVFLAFPSDAEWSIPTRGWHVDANIAGPLWPARGVKTFALFGDIVPRGGGTLIVSGSHRLIHAHFQKNPPPPGARNADLRKLLLAHPYIHDLHSEGVANRRISRFMDNTEVVEGIPLRVIEGIGRAGDVILAHPLVLHVAAPNVSKKPRFLLSGGITTDMWGWDS